MKPSPRIVGMEKLELFGIIRQSLFLFFPLWSVTLSLSSSPTRNGRVPFAASLGKINVLVFKVDSLVFDVELLKYSL
jgi:hypothetical protein